MSRGFYLEDGTEVYIEIDASSYDDDIQLLSVTYADGELAGKEVEDEEAIQYLYDNYGDVFYNEWYEAKVERADALREYWSER